MEDTKNRLTDTEVIAQWMEPKPSIDVYVHPGKSSPCLWWFVFYPPATDDTTDYGEPFWKARPLTLNECHLVEAKLSDEDKAEYDIGLQAVMLGDGDDQYVWHATAEQKIRALAEVLRPVVEKKSTLRTPEDK